LNLVQAARFEKDDAENGDKGRKDFRELWPSQCRSRLRVKT